MDLGELAFKVEDIQRAIKTVDSEWEYDPDLENPAEVKKVIHMFNQILAEKLEKSLKLYRDSRCPSTWGDRPWRWVDENAVFKHDTTDATGFLVCIEEIKK